MIKATHRMFLFLLLCTFGLSAAPIQYENLLVEKVDVVVVTKSGESRDDSFTICERLKTREGVTFSQIAFDCDLKLLSKEYDRVEPYLALNNGKLFVTIKLWKRPTLRSIEFLGNRKISTQALRDELGLAVCSSFDRQSFNQAFNKLRTFYIQKGFFESQLTYETTLDDCTDSVDIVVNICEGRAGKIKSIEFYNFEPCEEEELLDMLVTKQYTPFLSLLSGEGTYHEEAVQHDRMVILNYLQNRGYADAKVNIEVTEYISRHGRPVKDRIAVKIYAERGELYRMGNVTFSGNTYFDNDAVRIALAVYPGLPFGPEELRAAESRVSKLYGRRGYIDSFVHFDAKLRCDENVYDIHFTIEEGQQYRVGLIKVFGNCITQTPVILHETLLSPGDLFNTEKLCKTEERLTNINYFKHVNVYPVRPEGHVLLEGCYRDIHIEVEEGQTGNIGGFGGFSTMESLFVGINLTERNFNAAGLMSCWSDGPCTLRGGGEYAHATISFGLKSRKYVLSYAKPYFMDSKWTVGFDIERSSNRYISEDYDINSTLFNLYGFYDVNAFVRTGVHYRIRSTNVTANKGAAIKSDHEKNGLISAIGTSWTYDTRNNPSCPTNGLLSRFEAECAGVLTVDKFISLGYLNSYYFPSMFDEKGVFTIRSDFKFIIPFYKTGRSDIPLDERFFLGGDEVVRGFRPYMLGPKYDINEPRGGLSLQYISAEYGRFLNKRVEAFTFLDMGFLSAKVGRVFYTNEDKYSASSRKYLQKEAAEGGSTGADAQHNLKEIRKGHEKNPLNIAVGVGLRLKVLDSAPPLMIGYGFPISWPYDHSEKKTFFFTIGGKF